MDVVKDHLKFKQYESGYLFRDWEGFKRAYSIPDRVIYIAPNQYRYLIIPHPTDGLQGVLYTSNRTIPEGYNCGKQYFTAHVGGNNQTWVYAFLPAFNEVRHRPIEWFDHLKKNLITVKNEEVING